MGDDYVTYLKMVQDVITRMNHCSFLIKGWAISILSVMAAIIGKEGKQSLLICLVPIVAFWALDAFYLWKERMYCCLYDEIVHRRAENCSTADAALFSMDATKCARINECRYKYVPCVFSRSILPLYASLCALVLLVNRFA